MSIQVYLTDKNAKSIVNNYDGSYDIYSNEDKRIYVDQVAQIRTGNIISLPLGYYSIIKPCELLNSYNIDVFNFASIHYHKYKFKKFSRTGKLDDIKNDMTELILTIKNVGRMEHLIKKGDLIAKLLIVKTEIFPVKIVNTIETEIDDQEEYELEKEINQEKEEIKKIDKNVFIWYKKKYMKDPAYILIDILDNSANTLLENIKSSEDWQITVNKKSFEASVLWDLLSNEDREKIIKNYELSINEVGIDLEPKNKNKNKNKIKKQSKKEMFDSESESESSEDL